MLDSCGHCAGVYVDAVAMARLLVDRPTTLYAALRDRFPGPPHDPVLEGARPIYVHCPDCKTLMNRQQFALHGGVIVDSCRGHGVWFDAGELGRVLDFIERGGLERAIAEADHVHRAAAARRHAVDHVGAKLSAGQVAPTETPTLASMFALIWGKR